MQGGAVHGDEALGLVHPMVREHNRQVFQIRNRPLLGDQLASRMQSVSVHFSLGPRLRYKMIASIQEPFRDDVIRSRLKTDRPV